MLLDPLPAAGGAGAVNRPALAAPSQARPLLAAVVLATALAYALAALLSLLCSAPAYAQSGSTWSLNAAAGVALAAALAYGRAALVGVALGSFIFQVGLGISRSPGAAHIAAVLPALLALGAALQAGVAAILLRRFLPQPMRLKRWTDILLAGLLGALLASSVGASVTTAALLTQAPLTLAGAAAAAAPAVAHWLKWWVGDSLGVLIVTPMVLAFIGHPHTLWRARRHSVALPLLLALGLMGAASTLLHRSEQQRGVADFETSASDLARQLEARLGTATHALQAVHGALRALPGEQLPNSETLWQAAQWWWTQPVGLQAVALASREAILAQKTGGEEAADAPSEHTAMRYRVPAPAATENLPTHLEAQAPRAAQAGLQRARRHGELVLLTEPLPGMGRSSAGQVTLVQALYRGAAANDAARQALFGAYLLVGFDLQRTLAGLETSKTTALPWCLYDSSDGAAHAAPLRADPAGGHSEPPRLLAGSASCTAPSLAGPAPSVRHWQQRLRLADRELLLQINDAHLTRVDAVGSAVLLLGLCGVAALSALLLYLTGRSPVAARSDLVTPTAVAAPGPDKAPSIESGALSLKLELVAVQPFLQDCLERVHPCAEDRAVLLSQPSPGEITPALTVQVDRKRLTQVLTHLLNNAIHFNHEGGAVVVHAERVDPDSVELSVADTGRGMSPEQVAGLFETDIGLAHTGKESADADAGAGLATCRRLVELMGGTLEVQSQAGVGSTFKLRLPGLESTQAAPALAAAKPAADLPHLVHYVQGPASPDDPVRGALEQHPQIELSVSSLGLDGLSAVRRLRPDLVLLNAQLPDINALELLRHLKRDPTLAHIAVILVSAQASADTLKRAATLGVLHCVTHPLDAAQFLASVDEALSGQARRERSKRDHRPSRGHDHSPGYSANHNPNHSPNHSQNHGRDGRQAPSRDNSVDRSRDHNRDLSQV